MIGISTRTTSLALSLQRSTPVRVFDFTGGALPAGVNILRASSGTCFNASGQLTTVPANQPRFDHDPVTGAFRGLLIEESRTNMALYSSATAGTWTPNTAALTDLSQNALGQFPGLQVAGTGALWHRATTTCTLLANTAQTFTFYYRAGTSGAMRFTLSGAAGVLFIDGNVGALAVSRIDFGTVTNLTQTVLKDGLTHRLRFTFQSSSSGSYLVGGGPRSSVSGQTVIVHGLQVEGGTTATSYIASGASEVTRARDQIQIPVLSGSYNLDLEYEGNQSVHYNGLSGTGITLTSPPAGRLRTITATMT